jgi:hypothetical protein
MELASYHLSDAWNFEVVSRFLENVCIPELKDAVSTVEMM